MLTRIGIRGVEVANQDNIEDNYQRQRENPQDDDNSPVTGRRANDWIQCHANEKAHK